MSDDLHGDDDAAPARVGALIRRRRLGRLISSANALSERMRQEGYRLSGSRIHDIEQGQTRTGRPTNASPVVLAQLALVLQITAEELEEVGRPDAAEVLREHVLQSTRDARVASLGLSPGMLQAVAAGLDEIRNNKGLTDGQKAELVRAFLERYEQSAQAVTDTIHDTLRALGDDGS